jgi:hypothetical protein
MPEAFLSIVSKADMTLSCTSGEPFDLTHTASYFNCSSNRVLVVQQKRQHVRCVDVGICIVWHVFILER